jgi:hypothetical protein
VEGKSLLAVRSRGDRDRGRQLTEIAIIGRELLTRLTPIHQRPLMIDLIGCNPGHVNFAIIVAAALGCLFGCLATQYMCNRDWRRYRLLVERQQAQQQFLVQRLVHHTLKEMVDLDHGRGQVIEAQAVVEQA